MLFRDYKHIELIEDITIPTSRVENNKLINVKNWKPTNPFRLRVKATVVKSGKRTIKKRTYVYNEPNNPMNMVEALKEAGKELDTLLSEIKNEQQTRTIAVKDDKDKMFTFKEAFYRSLESRKLQAEADDEEFRSYDSIKRFYINHLESLADIPLDKIDKDMLNSIRANMKHPDGTPFAKKTKLAVLQMVNPVYTWFNDYSHLVVKSPAKLPTGAIKKLKNERRVKVDDIAPLFNAMYNYTYTVWGKEYSDPYRSIFIWLMHGRRVNEVLSLDWKDINLKAGTYTIVAGKNKAKMDMTYKLTPYLLETLTEPKKSGMVFPSRKTKTKIGADVLWNHWEKARDVVGTWTLNDKEVGPEELHMHDIRHILTTEMLNKHNIIDEISGAVLGHTRSGITARYAEMMIESVDNAIMKVLDRVLK